MRANRSLHADTQRHCVPVNSSVSRQERDRVRPNIVLVDFESVQPTSFGQQNIFCGRADVAGNVEIQRIPPDALRQALGPRRLRSDQP